MTHEQNPIKSKLRKFQSSYETKFTDSDISFLPSPARLSAKETLDNSEDTILKNLIRQQEERIRDLTHDLCQEEDKYCKKYAKREAQLHDRILKLHERLTFQIKRNQHLQQHLSSLKGVPECSFSQLTTNHEYLLSDI